VCLRRIIAANKFDGIGLADCLQSYRVSGTNPCVPALRLLDEGTPAACEGDMSGLEVQLLTHWLFGRPSFIGEGQPTLRNTRIGAHCTAPTKLNGYDQPHEPFLLMPHSETGRGVAPQVKWKGNRHENERETELPARCRSDESDVLACRGSFGRCMLAGGMLDRSHGCCRRCRLRRQPGKATADLDPSPRVDR
jgi:hypothetical protein